MARRERSTKSSRASAALAQGRDEEIVPDLTEFERQEWALGSLSGAQLITLIDTVAGEISHATRAENVPLEILECMGWDPVISLGEAIASAPVKEPASYYVRHPDPVVRAETDAWLDQLLPDLMPVIARSIVYGAIPYVFDWKVEDLHITIQREGSAKEPAVARNHQHFGRVHEIWPGDVTIVEEKGTGAFLGIRHGKKEYGVDRAFVSVWGKKFGWWLGEGSRRRAYRAWFKSAMVEIWQARWLERSVDAPRIGFAPKGDVTINGKKVPAIRVMNAVLMALKNGSAGTLPSERDPVTKERLWGVELLRMDDRSSVWDRSLDRFDVQKLFASWAPPAVAGSENLANAAAKVPAEAFGEVIQGHVNFAARELTTIANVVHRVMHGDKSPPVEVCARELPKQRRKLLLEVFKGVKDAVRRTKDGKVYRVSELVADTFLDDLGIERRPIDEVAHAPDGFDAEEGGPPGRPRDATGDREDRREDARTDEGEDATGAPDEGEEQARAPRRASARGGKGRAKGRRRKAG